MIVSDVNLLLYAYDSDSPFHGKAVAWWQRCLSGPEPIGLPTAVVFAFMRIGTNARVFQKPMSPSNRVQSCTRQMLISRGFQACVGLIP